MKRLVLICLVITAISVSVAFASYSGGNSSAKIMMTSEKGDQRVTLMGSGTATVDWGDGSEKVTLTLNENGVAFEHTYPNATKRTITINGNNITGLRCGDITSLDVSGCTELKKLHYRGILPILDVSKNTALTELMLIGQPSAAAFNALFGTLHSNAGEKKIFTGGTGADECDRSIAEKKGWTFQ